MSNGIRGIKARYTVGTRVLLRLDVRQRGVIVRIYPFDGANIMVKFDDGRIKSFNRGDLVL